MRSIFRKEWRQAHLLPWTGLLLSAMIMVLYMIWTTKFTQTPQDADDLDGFCVLIILLGSGMMLLVSTTGLIASETSTGTISYLLGLPVSRSRIWWGKALAGAALSGAAAALLAVPAMLVLPSLRTQGHFMLFLPDFLAWGIAIYAVGLFCSTVFARPLSVFIGAPLVLIALTFAAVGMMEFLKVKPLQYDSGTADLSLWMLVWSPAFLLASWAAFTRGELFDSRRRWWYAFPTLAAGLLVVALAMFGFTRWEFSYRRGAVAAIENVGFTSGGRAMTLLAMGSRGSLVRDTTGWRTTGSVRSEHTVLVDLNTGRDLMVWPGFRDVTASPDGMKALVQEGAEEGQPNIGVEVWDVAARRVRFTADSLAPMRHEGTGAIAWSQDSQWFACASYENHGGPGSARDKQTLFVFHADGKLRREVLLWEQEQVPETNGGLTPSDIAQGRRPQMRTISAEFITAWDWIPGQDALYLLTLDGALYRYDPADQTRTVLWKRAPGYPPGEPWMRYQIRMAPSPDGTRLAIRAPEVAPSEQHAAKYHTWVLTVERTRARQTVEFTDAQPNYVPLVWAGDSRTLYLGGVSRWTEGETHATPLVGREKLLWPKGPGPIPFGSGVLTSREGGMSTGLWIQGPGKAVPLRQVFPQLGPGGYIVGTDAQGRLVLNGGSEIGALDPKTGRVTRIYP